jgi:hypothetical protein
MSLLALSADIIERVVQRLDLAGLWAADQTSRGLRSATRTPWLWVYHTIALGRVVGPVPTPVRLASVPNLDNSGLHIHSIVTPVLCRAGFDRRRAARQLPLDVADGVRETVTRCMRLLAQVAGEYRVHRHSIHRVLVVDDPSVGARAEATALLSRLARAGPPRRCSSLYRIPDVAGACRVLEARLTEAIRVGGDYRAAESRGTVSGRAAVRRNVRRIRNVLGQVAGDMQRAGRIIDMTERRRPC